MKIMCLDKDCFSMVKIDEFTTRYENGEPHESELFCSKHQTKKHRTNIKNFKKRQRKKLKELLEK